MGWRQGFEVVTPLETKFLMQGGFWTGCGPELGLVQMLCDGLGSGLTARQTAFSIESYVKVTLLWCGRADVGARTENVSYAILC